MDSKNKLKNNFLLLILLLVTPLTSKAYNEDNNAISQVGNSDPLYLGTAQKEGEYYDIGSSISKLINSKSISNAKAIATKGSVANIEGLLNGQLHMALVQSDILFKYNNNLLSGLPNKGEIGAISSLFPEYIQVFVRNKDKEKYSSLAKLNGKKIYLGTKGSGTESNALELLSIYKIEESDIYRSNSSRENALTDLIKGDIDAAFITSGEKINIDGLHKLTFNQHFVDSLSHKYPFFSYKVERQLPEPAYSIYLRSVLVARYKSNSMRIGIEDDIVKKITSIVYENWTEIEKNSNVNVTFFPQHLIARKISLPLHSKSKEFYEENGILITLKPTYIALITLPLLVLLSVSFQKLSLSIKFRTTYLFKIKELVESYIPDKLISFFLSITTKYSWAMFFWIFFLIVSVDLAVISYFEEKYAHLNDIENPFAQKSIFQIIFWLLTFAVTGFNQDIFPNHLISQISAIIIPVAAVIGALFIVVHEQIEQDRIQERAEKGEITYSSKGCIVICGWNDRVPSLIKQILSPYTPPKKFKKILVIAETNIQKPIRLHNLQNEKVLFYRGTASSYNVLNNIEINASYATIIVADDKKVENGNIRGMLTASAIDDLTKDGYPIISEAFYPENIPYFKEHGVRQLICLKSYSSRILLHSLLNPGITDLLLNLLSYEPPYQLKEYKSEELSLTDTSYFQALKHLREKSNELLLAVYQNSKNTQHEPFELNFRKDTPYLVNPIQNGLDAPVDNYINQSSDLIVLSNVSESLFNHPSMLQNISFDAVEPESESILIIGNNEIAIKICQQLAHLVKSVSLVEISSSETETKTLKEGYHHYVVNSLKASLENGEIPISNSTRVLVLAQENTQESREQNIQQDDKSLHIIFTIRSYFLHKLKCDPPHIASEIKHLDNKNLFYNTHVKQLVPTNTFFELMLTRQIFHLGKVSNFIIKSISYNNENSLVRLEKWSIQKLVQKSNIDNIENYCYDTLLLHCLPFGIQILAIETSKNDTKHLIVNPENEDDKKRSILLKDKVYAFIKAESNKPQNTKELSKEDDSISNNQTLSA